MIGSGRRERRPALHQKLGHHYRLRSLLPYLVAARLTDAAASLTSAQEDAPGIPGLRCSHHIVTLRAPLGSLLSTSRCRCSLLFLPPTFPLFRLHTSMSGRVF